MSGNEIVWQVVVRTWKSQIIQGHQTVNILLAIYPSNGENPTTRVHEIFLTYFKMRSLWLELCFCGLPGHISSVRGDGKASPVSGKGRFVIFTQIVTVHLLFQVAFRNFRSLLFCWKEIFLSTKIREEKVKIEIQGFVLRIINVDILNLAY